MRGQRLLIRLYGRWIFGVEQIAVAQPRIPVRPAHVDLGRTETFALAKIFIPGGSGRRANLHKYLPGLSDPGGWRWRVIFRRPLVQPSDRGFDKPRADVFVFQFGIVLDTRDDLIRISTFAEQFLSLII